MKFISPRCSEVTSKGYVFKFTKGYYETNDDKEIEILIGLHPMVVPEVMSISTSTEASLEALMPKKKKKPSIDDISETVANMVEEHFNNYPDEYPN